MPKNIIFDWSGVISDDRDMVLNTTNKIRAYYGGKPISWRTLQRSLEYPLTKVWQRWFGDIDLDELKSLWDTYIHESGKCFLYPGMDDLIRDLSTHRKLAVLSNHTPSKLMQEAEEYGIAKHFVQIVGASGSKPDDILKLMQNHAMATIRTVIVGDTPDEIAAGRRANIPVICVTWGYFGKRLKGMQYTELVDTVEDLRKILM